MVFVAIVAYAAFWFAVGWYLYDLVQWWKRRRNRDG
jgi:hypothetical protein